MRYALSTLLHFVLPIIFKLFLYIYLIYFLYFIYNLFLSTYSIIILKMLIFLVFRNTSISFSLFYFISILIGDGSAISTLIRPSRLVEVLSHPQKGKQHP